MVRRSTLFGNILLMGGLALGLSSSQAQIAQPTSDTSEEQTVYSRRPPRQFMHVVEEEVTQTEEDLNGKMALFGEMDDTLIPLDEIVIEDEVIEYGSESIEEIEGLREDSEGPIRVDWVDEMSREHWIEYPNSCGPAALYMFLTGLGIEVDLDDLIANLRAERPGGYDPYCCLDGSEFQKYVPDPEGFCNPTCVSSEALASVARTHYNLDIESGSGWTREMVEDRLEEHTPTLILVRVNFSLNQFGHYVVVIGSEGDYAIVADSYPSEAYWSSTSEERQAVGEERWVLWEDLLASWATKIDGRDPLGGPHTHWGMSLALAVQEEEQEQEPEPLEEYLIESGRHIPY